MSEVHGEDYDIEPIHPAKYVRFLKRHLKNVLNGPVLGCSLASGKGTVYSDIYYTIAAIQLRHEGALWKQFVDARAVFKPAEEQ
jgi:hypothetical protein